MAAESPRALVRLLAELPDGALLPVAWIREQLGAEPEESIGDLTLEQVAEIVGRTVSTVRGWAPRIPGSFKLNGKQWRVPRSGLREFMDRQREEQSQPTVAVPQAVDLSSWRRHIKGSR